MTMTELVVAIDAGTTGVAYDGNYYVAFHEWVKSIMLGDRYYYKEYRTSIKSIIK